MNKTIAVVAMGVALTFAGSTNLQAGLLDKLQKTITDTTSSGSGGAGSSAASNLSTGQITDGLKEALRVGTETVVGQIGTTDGYYADPAIHIPLPEKMQQAQSLLKKFGLSGMADEVEERLNRGAEAAAPKTKEIIYAAISEMTLDDAREIYNGPDDAATQYFRKVSTADLTETVRPIIEQSLQDVGAFTAYDNLVSQYKSYPLVPDIRSDLTGHATEMTLEGLFYYLAKEEAAIRTDPVKRTTEILTTVFGN
ncbi:DUF4197 domain-containing protein [Sneathiella sp. CAU 1612]|jgi:hypothetical protein|uniref:DUF4197 domain-containing protein n=1 Tax=Sneathiella sedimenti TaxID=2816034 RepID=A0ABS3F294_9PROT|nr:DUF4197 domain-containing protein [Sneathiella sedimenti]MBO0332453.1 DUF4197 domain-containing protein [Sneathiella sedimenti]